MSDCAVCWNEKNPDEFASQADCRWILQEFKVCSKHKEKLMQCSVCGSQDTKYVTGMSKKTGKPWAAYDCNEKQCKNEKGYSSRTFVPGPKGAVAKSTPVVSSTLEKKVDEILAILKSNFKSTVLKRELEEQIEEESPF